MSRFRRHNSVQVQWRRLHDNCFAERQRNDDSEDSVAFNAKTRSHSTPPPSPSCLHSTTQVPPNSMKPDWPCHFLLGRVSPLQMSVHSPPPMLQTWRASLVQRTNRAGHLPEYRSNHSPFLLTIVRKVIGDTAVSAPRAVHSRISVQIRTKLRKGTRFTASAPGTACST